MPGLADRIKQDACVRDWWLVSPPHPELARVPPTARRAAVVAADHHGHRESHSSGPVFGHAAAARAADRGCSSCRSPRSRCSPAAWTGSGGRGLPGGGVRGRSCSSPGWSLGLLIPVSISRSGRRCDCARTSSRSPSAQSLLLGVGSLGAESAAGQRIAERRWSVPPWHRPAAPRPEGRPAPSGGPSAGGRLIGAVSSSAAEVSSAPSESASPPMARPASALATFGGSSRFTAMPTAAPTSVSAMR